MGCNRSSVSCQAAACLAWWEDVPLILAQMWGPSKTANQSSARCKSILDKRKLIVCLNRYKSHDSLWATYMTNDTIITAMGHRKPHLSYKRYRGSLQTVSHVWNSLVLPRQDAHSHLVHMTWQSDSMFCWKKANYNITTLLCYATLTSLK